jgi:hypothetical protein
VIYNYSLPQGPFINFVLQKMIHNLNQPQELMVQLFLCILRHLHDDV